MKERMAGCKETSSEKRKAVSLLGPHGGKKKSQAPEQKEEEVRWGNKKVNYQSDVEITK